MLEIRPHIALGLLAIATWALLGDLPARGEPRFDVRFTSDTPGNPPATVAANAGGLSTKPTMVVTGSGNSVIVQDTYVDSMTGNVLGGGGLGDGNVVVFKDIGAGSNALLFQGALADQVSSGVHTISLDWIEDKGIPASSSAFIGLTNQSRTQSLSALFLDLGDDSGNLRSGNSVNFGTTLGTAARGVAHHLDWVIDLNQADFSIATEVYLDGAFLANQRREPIGIPHDGASALGNLAISTSGPAVGTLAFDNIQFRAGRHVAVPEAPVYPGPRKLIELGFDAPDTAYMRDHIATMKNEPFSGVVFTARPNWGTNQEFTWGGWGNTVFTRAAMQHAVDELKATNFGNYNQNFLRYNMTPGNVDWFDNLDNVLANVGTAAWLVEQGGAKGIFFDTEDYQSPLWHYPSQKYRASKSFAEYAAQVRLRGQQVMATMQAEDPNLTLLIPVAYSYVWGPSQINGNLGLLPSVEYGLLPAFLDGMLDVAGPGIRFVDGFENAYGYTTLAQFQEARARMVAGTLPIVADDARYAEKFGFGFAAWMDAFWRTQGWHPDPNDFDQNYYTPAELEEILKSALTVSDEYVWLYSEQLFWRNANTAGSPDIPLAYDQAVRRNAPARTKPGDLNFDGIVNIFDINLISSHWGQTGPDGDANGDKIVNIFDINLISANWTASSPASAVPEPTSVGLLSMGGLLALAIRLRITKRLRLPIKYLQENRP